MRVVLVSTIFVLLITAVYVYGLSSLSSSLLPYEGFSSPLIRGDQDGGLYPVNSDGGLANVQQGLLLADVLTVSTGLVEQAPEECAAGDQARQLEEGGQYTQRTNNYRRSYPDSCSSTQLEFVGGFYAPKHGAVGTTVPCAGSCF